jgi:hypothetical protein
VRGAVLGVLLCAASGTTPLFAQVTAALEGGGSRISYSGSNDLNALSLSPSVEWLTASTRLTAEASFAQFSGGGWSLQGAVAGSGFTPSFGGLRGELAAAAVGSNRDDGVDAGELLGRARLHWLGAREGLWLGGSLGRGWNGVAWQSDRQGDVGGWLRRDAVTLLATAAPVWLGDSLRFVDADLTLRLAQGPIDLAALGGTRWWSRPAGAAGSSWGGATAAFWLGPHLAVVAAGGSYPADYAQGLPAGSYISLGLRLASRRPDREDSRGYDAALARIGHPSEVGHGSLMPAPVVPAFEVGPSGEGRQRFRLRAPGAQSVELIGDFTEWQPLPLARASDGSWKVTLELAPGVYRVNLRVDGGVWGVPPGLPAITDDFGGAVGILRIGR